MAKVLEKDAVLIETTGGNAFELVADVFRQNNVKTVGFEDTEITYSEYVAFCEKLAGFELVPVGDAILVQRRFKSDDEIEYITKAQKITDKAFKIFSALSSPTSRSLTSRSSWSIRCAKTARAVLPSTR